jgi:predicted Zn-ribbon and HTH transcriptional regulator
MPVIYQGRCTACDAVTGSTSDGYSAVYVDEPATAYAHPDDPHLVILAHPGESLILEEVGYTHKAAASGGRLVAVRQVYCKECGRPFEVRRLTAGLTALGCGGCLGVVALAAVAGVGIGVLVGGWVGDVAGWTAFGLLVAVGEVAVRRSIRWRYSDRARRVDTPTQCPNCGSRRYACPGSLWRPIP